MKPGGNYASSEFTVSSAYFPYDKDKLLPTTSWQKFHAFGGVLSTELVWFIGLLMI